MLGPAFRRCLSQGAQVHVSIHLSAEVPGTCVKLGIALFEPWIFTPGPRPMLGRHVQFLWSLVFGCIPPAPWIFLGAPSPSPADVAPLRRRKLFRAAGRVRLRGRGLCAPRVAGQHLRGPGRRQGARSGLMSELPCESDLCD